MPASPSDVLQHPGRLQALRETELLDSEPELCFDRLTRMAAYLLQSPYSALTLIDGARAYLKSSVGFTEPARECDLSRSICKHVVERGEAFVVADARNDPGLRDHPAVCGGGIVGYLGIPITTRDGFRLGALCVADTAVREWSETEITTLRELARVASAEVDYRRAALAMRRYATGPGGRALDFGARTTSPLRSRA